MTCCKFGSETADDARAQTRSHSCMGVAFFTAIVAVVGVSTGRRPCSRPGWRSCCISSLSLRETRPSRCSGLVFKRTLACSTCCVSVLPTACPLDHARCSTLSLRCSCLIPQIIPCPASTLTPATPSYFPSLVHVVLSNRQFGRLWRRVIDSCRWCMPTINVTTNTGPRALMRSIALQVSGSVVSDLVELTQLGNWRNPSHAQSYANVCGRRDTCGGAGATFHLKQQSIRHPVPANTPQQLERASSLKH